MKLLLLLSTTRDCVSQFFNNRPFDTVFFLSNLYSSNVFLLENLDKIKSLQLKDFTSILKTELPRFNRIKIGDCTPYNLATRVRENII